MPKTRKNKPLSQATLLRLVHCERPLYFRRQDSLKMWGIPPRTLEDLAAEGKGCSYYRVGKFAVYSVDDFEEWLQQNPVLKAG